MPTVWEKEANFSLGTSQSITSMKGISLVISSIDRSQAVEKILSITENLVYLRVLIQQQKVSEMNTT